MKRVVSMMIVLMGIKGLVGYPPKPLPNPSGCACYLNSVIQNLYTLNPLTDLLLSRPNPYPPNTTTAAYVNFIRALAAAPNYDENVADLSEYVRAYEDELANLFGYVDRTMVRITDGQPLEQQDATEFLVPFLGDLIETSPVFKKPLTQLLVSQLQSELICPKANYRSATTEPYTLLNPEIFGSSLDSCMANFFIKENLEEYTIEETKQLQRDCTRQLSIKRAAPILIIGLKRFRINLETLILEKVFTQVAIPFNYDLAPYMTDKKSNPYELHGFAIHQGATPRGGHWVAYVKDAGTWYYCSDMSVRRVTLKEAQASARQSVVLFYVKPQPAPPVKKPEPKPKPKAPTPAIEPKGKRPRLVPPYIPKLRLPRPYIFKAPVRPLQQIDILNFHLRRLNRALARLSKIFTFPEPTKKAKASRKK